MLGWRILDPLAAKEIARAARDFFRENMAERSAVAVVYSHSRADRFGGVRRVADEVDSTDGPALWDAYLCRPERRSERVR